MRVSHIRDIRSFNRFYTRVQNELESYGAESGYSMPEIKILFELFHNDGLTASDLMMLLEMDKGYLSRLLQKMEKDRLINRVKDKKDRRAVCVQLTAKGKKEYEKLNTAAEAVIREMFSNLSELECERLVQKMREVQQLIQKK